MVGTYVLVRLFVAPELDAMLFLRQVLAALDDLLSIDDSSQLRIIRKCHRGPCVDFMLEKL